MTRRLVITGAVCLAVGAAAGYLARPAPEIQERVVVQQVEVFADRTEWVTRRDAAEETHRVREETRGPVVIHYPDGRREERGPVQVREEAGARRQETESTEGVRVVEVERLVEVETERVVHVPDRPEWLFAAQVAAGSTGTMYGGQVARRVLGPLYVAAGGLAGDGEWVVTAGVGIGF